MTGLRRRLAVAVAVSGGAGLLPVWPGTMRLGARQQPVRGRTLQHDPMKGYYFAEHDHGQNQPQLEQQSPQSYRALPLEYAQQPQLHGHRANTY